MAAPGSAGLQDLIGTCWRDGSAVALDGNVVSGGYAFLSGGGDNATVTYSTGGAGAMTFHAQAGRVVHGVHSPGRHQPWPRSVAARRWRQR